MAITISGENNNDKILASDGVIDQLSGVNLVGVLTATTFSGDFIGNLTGNVTGNINNSTLLLQTGGTERVRIDSNGRIGLGINNPSSYFSSYNRVVMGRTNDTGGMTIVSAPTSGGYIAFADGTSGNTAYRGIIAYQHSADSLTFGTDGGTERLRITNSGKVGINTDNPTMTLTVRGTILKTRSDSGLGLIYLNHDGSNNGYIDVNQNGGVTRVKLNSAGDSYFNGGKLFVGTTSGNNANKIHARLANGSIANNSNQSVILAENNTNTWITIGSGASNYGGILFADSGASDIGQVRYNHSTNGLEFLTNGGNSSNIRLKISSTGATEITGTDDQDNLVVNASSTQFAVHQDDTDGEVSLRAQDGSGNNYAKYMTFYTHPSGSAAAERLRITHEGRVGINSTAPSTPLELYTAAGSNAWKFRINTSVSDGAGLYQRANGDFELVLRDASNNNNFISGNSGGLEFATSGTEKFRITSGGQIGISPGAVTPTAGDLQSGDSQNTPIIHVKGSGVSATGGEYNLLARFEAGGDADGTGAMIVLNHSNDRGLAIQGGRRTGNYAHGALKMIDNVGRVSDAMLIHGGAGQGVDHINFYTGVSTTTTNRLHIDSSGRVLIGTTNTSNGHIAASKAAVHGHLAIFKDSEGDNAGVNSHQIKFVTQSGSISEIMATSAGAGGPSGRGGYLSFFAKPNNSSTLKEMLRVGDDIVTILRQSSSLEGGELALARASDNTAYWHLDSYGSSSTPNFRIHAAGNSHFSINPSGQWVDAPPGTVIQVAYGRYDPNTDTYAVISQDTKARSPAYVDITPLRSDSKLMIQAKLHTRMQNAYGSSFGLDYSTDSGSSWTALTSGMVNRGGASLDFFYKGEARNHHYTSHMTTYIDSFTGSRRFSPWGQGWGTGTWELSYGHGEHSVIIFEIAT